MYGQITRGGNQRIVINTFTVGQEAKTGMVLVLTRSQPVFSRICMYCGNMMVMKRVKRRCP